MSENYFMDDKLFLFFFRKLGSTTINGNEYAYCCPWNLEINENGELVVAGVVVDREGNFYSLEWLQFGNEDWGNPIVKKIGKFKELPEKIINKIESYLEKLERREIDMKVKNIVNNDTAEIIKKLVHGLDFRTCYVVEYLHDGSVDVRELDVVRDKKSGKIICYKDKE